MAEYAADWARLSASWSDARSTARWRMAGCGRIVLTLPVNTQGLAEGEKLSKLCNRLPLVKEGGASSGAHIAHVLELLVCLKIAASVEQRSPGTHLSSMGTLFLATSTL